MIVILILIFLILMLNKNIASSAVNEAFFYWLGNIVPMLYPNYILIDLISNTKSITFISKKLFTLFRILFGIKYEASAFIILISFFSGNPGNIKLISNLKDKGIIDKEEANHLIRITSVMAPFFILLTIQLGIVIEHSALIFIAYYLGVIIVMIFEGNQYNREKIRYTSAVIKDNNFGKVFSKSLEKNMLIMLNILGILMIFSIISSFIPESLKFLIGFLEITTGITQIYRLQHEMAKIILILAFISFEGITIQLQIGQIFSDFKYLHFVSYCIKKAIVVILLGVLLYIESVIGIALLLLGFGLWFTSQKCERKNCCY